MTFLLALFGCPHERETFPRTVRDEYGRARCYVCCLDCGQETEYDWGRMERLPKRTKQAGVALGETYG